MDLWIAEGTWAGRFLKNYFEAAVKNGRRFYLLLFQNTKTRGGESTNLTINLVWPNRDSACSLL